MPVLLLLVELAIQYSSLPDSSDMSTGASVDLLRLVIEELFFYAFLSPKSSPQLKMEAVSALTELCYEKATTLDLLVSEIGIHLPNLNAREVAVFLSKELLARWAPSENAAGWLGYFISRRSIAALPLASSPEFDVAVDSMIHVFLQAPPQVQFNPAIQQAAFTVASQVFAAVNWSACAPSAVSKIYLSVLASQGLVPEPWRRVAFTSLLHAHADVSRLLGDAVASRIMKLEPKADDPLISLVQCRIALSYALSEQNELRVQRDLRWLIEWGLFRRLALVTNHSDMAEMFYKVLMPQTFACVRREPFKEAFTLLSGILDSLASVDQGFARCVGEELLRTLANGSDPAVFGSWVTFWSYLLLPRLDLKRGGATSRAYERLINILVHGLFCNNANFEELSLLAKTPNTPSAFDILSCIERGFPWTACSSDLTVIPFRLLDFSSSFCLFRFGLVGLSAATPSA